MKKFFYKGLKENKKVSGYIEGETKEDVAEILLNQNVIILSIKENNINFDFIKEINIGGIPSKEKMFFMRQLAFMIVSGVPLVQALELASKQIKNLGFKNQMLKVTKEVQGGITLSQAIENKKKLFDKVTINLIRAGEESGKLDTILIKIADNLEKKEDFKSKLQGALIYPIVVIIAIIGVIIALMVFMVPEMSK
ncbi:MAG: type II secretion system F family protein, partial [Endomicrobia bacterium]|nr:type II secretion system F family protein [Endomicrobiia bacterium]